MLHHHCRRNPELQEELQIQAAVAAGDVHTVRKMLEQGYSPNGRDANGWTLLHFSAARGKEPVHHQLPEFTQTHIHRVGDAIQPSHPLSSPSPLAPNPSQHQSLFQ